MLRNAVRCNPHGAIVPLPSKGATANGKKPFRPVTVNLDIAVSPITRAFTLRRCAVAPLRETFFCLSRNAACHSMGEDFYSRNDATLRAKQNLQGFPYYHLETWLCANNIRILQFFAIAGSPLKFDRPFK